MCVACEASRPVDLTIAASYEIVDTPMSLFYSDQTIRKGPKSDLMKLIKNTANVQSHESLSDLYPASTQFIIDCMGHVYRNSLERLSTFGEHVDRYCQSIFKLPGCRIDIVIDRYDAPSIKDQTRTISAEQVNKGPKRTLIKKLSRKQ